MSARSGSAIRRFAAGDRRWRRGAPRRRRAPGRRPTAIVSLGDSFISGEGGRWLGNGSEPFGTRSGTDRAAFDCDGWGLRVRPGAGLRRLRGRTIATAPTWRRSAARRSRSPRRSTSPARGRRRANSGRRRRAGRPHFGEPPQADQLARGGAARRRAAGRAHGRRQRRRLRRAGRRLRARLGPQLPRTTRPSASGDAQAEIEAALPAIASAGFAQGAARGPGDDGAPPATGARTTGWW